jgi:hypothetical protein
MEGLTEQEKQFFESGGTTEVETEVSETVEPVVEQPKVEVPAEKKKPTKFDYSPDTDNVVDDLGRKYVPLPAVQNAREENKALRRELDELKTKWTGGEQKLNALLERLQGKKEEPVAYDKDPLTHLKSKNDELEAKIKALSDADQQRSKETETTTQLQAFSRDVQAAERAFAAKQPDYGDAVSRVQEMWRAELEVAGVPENFIDTMLAKKGAQFAYAALQKGENSAEAVYKLAQRYGYKSAPKEENKDKDKLKTIARGQEAEKSLASGKGSDMSLEALASMSEEELDEFVEKGWGKLQKAAKSS